MKRWMIILLVFMMKIAFYAPAGFTDNAVVPEIRAGAYDADGQLISVKTKGMVCDFCAKALEKVLLNHDAISGINVDLTSKEVLINLKSGQSITDEKITQLIRDSGYKVVDILRVTQSQ